MTPHDDEPSLFDDQEEPNLIPPGEGFELYRHKDADKMRIRNWHGYYWARRTEEGDYEIRSVPSMLGEHSVPGRHAQGRLRETLQEGRPLVRLGLARMCLQAF
jgi:hypothetical protein